VALLAVIGLALYVPGRLLWAESHFRAAQEALRRRDFALAREHLLTYLEVRPNSAAAHLLLAQAARRTGFFEEAERRLAICERLEGPTPATDLERTLQSVQQGDLSAAGPLWAKIEEDVPETDLILEALCQGYRKNYLLQGTLRCLDCWLKRQPDNVEALLLRGWVRERQIDIRAAIADYRQALTAAPDNAEVKLRLARALLRSGQPRQALPLFQALAEASPADPAAGLGVALCHKQLGRIKQARRLLARLTAQHPQEFQVLYERGKFALETGHGAEAETWLRKAVALAPDDYQANYSLSLCLTRRGSPQEAQALRKRVKQLEANVVRIGDLTEKLQGRPAEPGLRCEIGELFLSIGEYQEGVYWLESALRADPAFRRAHKALADHYDRHEQPALADLHRRQAGGTPAQAAGP
jgi:tetratricopeptide (TPR) repeat protein